MPKRETEPKMGTGTAPKGGAPSKAMEGLARGLWRASRTVHRKDLHGKGKGKDGRERTDVRKVGTPPNPRTHAVAALADTCA